MAMHKADVVGCLLSSPLSEHANNFTKLNAVRESSLRRQFRFNFSWSRFCIADTHTAAAYTSTHRHIACKTGKDENLQNPQASAIQWRKQERRWPRIEVARTANGSLQSSIRKFFHVKITRRARFAQLWRPKPNKNCCESA